MRDHELPAVISSTPDNGGRGLFTMQSAPLFRHLHFYRGRFLPQCAAIFPVCAAVCLLGLPVAARAAAESDRVCSLQFENDFFGGGTDRHFTHGTRLGCLTRPIPWISAAVDKFPWFNPEKAGQAGDEKLKVRASMSIGQNIYTPEDIGTSRLITDDRPYAGWLYLGFGMVADQNGDRYDNIEFNIGIVGPQSYAEDVQKKWHSLFDLPTPNGWDNQLENELGVNLIYEQAHRLWKKELPGGMEYDVLPHFGGSAGNVFTYAAAGGTLRVGADLDDDFGPPRIRPSLPGSVYFRARDTFHWYLFAGVEGRAVIRNIFLDGNTFAHGHSMDKEFLVGDFQAGMALQVDRFRISYTQIFRSHEVEGQESADRFGSLNISCNF